MESLLTEAELLNFLTRHAGRPVVIFKHSTTCPISRAAYHEVAQFESQFPDVRVALIRVIEERPLSLAFAASTRIHHASPQAIVLVDGHPVWDASHYGITADALAAAVHRAAHATPQSRE